MATDTRWGRVEGPYRTKGKVAADLIRDAILSGRLEPGERLILRELQEHLGMSLTPIREGLQVLAADGLVIDDPHRGTTVAEFSERDVVEIYEVRARLESWATELAAARLVGEELELLRTSNAAIERAQLIGDSRAAEIANKQFHHDIYAAAGNAKLAATIMVLWRQTPWGTFRLVPDRLACAAKEHDVVIECLERGDAKAAGEAMAVHIAQAVAGLREYFRLNSSVESVRVDDPGLAAPHESPRRSQTQGAGR